MSFPTTLKAGDSFVCTYSYTYGSDPGAGSHTNVATANINNGTGGTNDYTGSATFDFASVTPTVTDATASLSDTNGHAFSNPISGAGSGVAITYDETFTCDADEGDHSNTATITETDSGSQHQSTATATVNCYALSVTKNATPALTTTYHWTIEKSVDPATVDLFDGQSGDVTWTVTWTKDAGTNSGWGVTGTITIQNPAPMAANGVSVTDMMTGGISGTVDCDPNTIGNQTTVDIPASSSAQCAYSASLPDGTTRTNTATAAFATVDYTGTAPVDFSGVTPTLVDDTATVTDDRGPLDQDVNSSGSTHYDETFTCGADEGDHTNNAHVRGDDTNTGGDDSATTTVNCYQLDVSKDAITTFTRNYDWDISKTRFIAPGENDGDNDPSTLTLAPNQTYTASYSVVVSVSSHTDSDWGVHGTITIDNPAPIDADGVSVSDLITEAGYGDVAATVDCDAVTAGNQTSVDIPANSSAECSYSAPLGDDSQRLNTATASLAGEDYTGGADVIFDDSNPSTLVDECVNVTDDHGGTLGQVCVGDSPKTFEYTLDIGPFAVCGDYTFMNTATYLAVNDENDTGETDSASYTVNIDIPCPEGCTLTQGYWKTHNDSFWGGAPRTPRGT